MDKMNISRRKFLGIAGAATAVSALGVSGLTGCSSGGGASSATFAEEPLAIPYPNPDQDKAVWKVDYVNDDLPADFVLDNWRMSIDEFPEDKIAVYADLNLSTEVSREGMDTLQTMGGADFTAKQFDWILATAKEKAGVDPEKITIMDLRGESHGLIDGNVFMWWIENNCVNESTPTEEVIELEKKQLADFKTQDKIELYQTTEWAADPNLPMLSFDKPEIMSEEELAVSKGCQYVRFADTNHFRPDDHEVDLFCEYMASMPEDQWIFMHCYAGEGRTTCFMCLADIYKNYDVASFDDIAARQGLIGPVDVRSEVNTTNKTHYKKKASIERRVFLQQFWLYCKETGLKDVTWTEWARNKGLTLNYYPMS